MKGVAELRLQRGEYQYSFATQRGITLVRESDLLAVECDVLESEFPCYFVDDNWREKFPAVENSFVVIDDSTDFLDYFDTSLSYSSNRYIIISKKIIDELRCSIHEVYEWKLSLLEENTFTLRHTNWDAEEFGIDIYTKYNNRVVVYTLSVTESEVYRRIFPNAIICNSLNEFITEMENSPKSGSKFIASGSVLGVHLQNILSHRNSNSIWLPESFEWLVLVAIEKMFHFHYDIKNLALTKSDGDWNSFYKEYLSKLITDTLYLHPYDLNNPPSWLLEGKIFNVIRNVVHNKFYK